jgi:hypothetical protein
MKLNEQIANFEKNEKLFEKQIKKFNSVLDETDDAGEIKIIVRRISETEEKIKTNFEDLAKAKIELEQLKQQYAGAEAVNAFYNVKDKINEFFGNNTEGQRDSLITIIKRCFIFSPYLVVDTGNTLFVFDTGSKYQFDKDALMSLEKEEIYKKHFTELLTEKTYFDVSQTMDDGFAKQKVYQAGQYKISEFKLTGKNKHFNTLSVECLFDRMNIKYDFSKHINVLFFMDL